MVQPGSKIRFTYTRPTQEVVTVKMTVLKVTGTGYVICRAPDRMTADQWAPKGYSPFSAAPTAPRNRFRFTLEAAQRALVS